MKLRLKISILFTIMILGLASVFSISNVNAAYAYSWSVNGEILSKGDSNKSGNVIWSDDNNYTGGVLTLNNYDGGQLKIECNGTDLGHVFAIKLVGNNKITVQNSVGIIANAPIVFIGDGTLTIEASVPIGSGSIINYDNTMIDIEHAKWNSRTTIKIEPTISNTTNVQYNEKTESNELATDHKDSIENSLIRILVLSYCIISFIAIIVLSIQLKSIKKSNKAHMS